MIINIEVKNRIATYVLSGANPVCGSNTDVVRFSFDDEWDGVDPKTARFIWNDQYYDVEFTGNTCPVPMFFNVTKVLIGVYAGEPVVNEPSLSSTKAVVPYELSVRCGYIAPNPESGEGFTNEAKGYAQAARTAADEANAAAERVESTLGEAYGMKAMGSLALTITPPDYVNGAEEDWVWKLGNCIFNSENNTVLLSGFTDYSGEPGAIHPNFDQIWRLMTCRLATISVEHHDQNAVLNYTRVYQAPCGGVRTVGESDVDFDGAQWKLRDTNFKTDVPLLIYTDNWQAPGHAYGPWAMFLAMPQDFFDSLDDSGLTMDAQPCTVTLTGYN